MAVVAKGSEGLGTDTWYIHVGRVFEMSSVDDIIDISRVGGDDGRDDAVGKRGTMKWEGIGWRTDDIG